MQNDPLFTQAMQEYIELLVAGEKESYHSDLEPFSAYADKLREQLRKGLSEFKKSYTRGHQIVIDTLKQLHPEEEIERYTPSAERLALLSDAPSFMKSVVDGKKLYELLGYSEDVLGRFYEAACHLSDEKRYSDAASAFFFLATLAPDRAAFWFELGQAFSQTGQYAEAVDAFARALELDPTKADAYLSTAALFRRLGNFEQAASALNIGLDLALKHSEEPWAQELVGALEAGKRQLDQ